METDRRSTARRDVRMIHVIQGAFEATARPGEVLTTILGSCVCTTLFDPYAAVGGMNHFLLPDGDGRNKGQMRYGLHAMELLINRLLKLGAQKERLQAKVFGGGCMHDNLSNIGESNSRFALRFLETEGIPLINHSVGGTSARRIRFWPTTGRVQQLMIGAEAMIAPEPLRTPPDASSGGVTFF
jgi:chemotaxis protein CheD